MPKRTYISSILVIGAKKPLPVGEGLGWGSVAAWPRVGVAGYIGVVPPSPTLPQRGRGLEGRGQEGGLGEVVLEPIVAVRGAGEGFGYAQDHAVGILQDFVVPEADDLVAMAFDHSGAGFVGGAIGMLTAIDLDHQLQSSAGEIGDGTSDLKLPRELNAQLLGAKPRPQAFRRVGRFAAQALRNRRQTLSYHPDTPSKLPSPSGNGWGWGLHSSIKRRTPIQTLPQWGRALPTLLAKSL